jgi:hypothetical protein
MSAQRRLQATVGITIGFGAVLFALALTSAIGSASSSDGPKAGPKAPDTTGTPPISLSNVDLVPRITWEDDCRIQGKRITFTTQNLLPDPVLVTTTMRSRGINYLVPPFSGPYSTSYEIYCNGYQCTWFAFELTVDYYNEVEENDETNNYLTQAFAYAPTFCPQPTSTSTATTTATIGSASGTPTLLTTGTQTTVASVTQVPATLIVSATAQSTAPTSATSTAIATPTACTVTFTDVDETNIFYPFIRCLACRGIISGYDDGTIRPFNDITRGQIAKIVSNAAGFNEGPGPQVYEDVPVGSPFYAWINRLSMRRHMGGYLCGLVPEEPCVEPDNLPYFRPANSATRGQLAKIVSNATGLSKTPSGQFYTDVPEGHTFYVWIMRLTDEGVMSGYDCGGEGEPCDGENRPYFRPFNNVTRGQASKITANALLPNCETPSR